VADASLDVLASALSAEQVRAVVFARLRLGAPWRLAVPPADHAGFHIVERGACWLEPDDATLPVALAERDLVLVTNGAGHGLADAPGSTAKAVKIDTIAPPSAGTRQIAAGLDGPETALVCGGYVFDGRARVPLLRILPPFLHVPHERASDGARSTLSLLLAELDSSGSGTRTIVSRLTDVLLVHVLRDWLRSVAGDDREWPAALGDAAVARALALLHEDPGASWSVVALARSVNLSRTTFVRRFRALVGEPPGTYLARVRMKAAARLLRETAAPLAEVGARVGYTSEYAFNRAFHRHQGTSPGRYRAQAPEPQGLLTRNSQSPSG
jgi:AraC-like DNA-binding protein